MRLALAVFAALPLLSCTEDDVPAPAESAPASPEPVVVRDSLGPYAPAREAGRAVFFSSVTAPPNEDGRAIGDVESQTGAALTVLEELLRDEGLGYEDVVHITVYLADEDGGMNISGFTRAWRRAFATRLQPAAPARTIVGVSDLPLEGARVALEAVAARPQPRSASPPEE